MPETSRGNFTTLNISRSVEESEPQKRFMTLVENIGRTVLPGDNVLLPVSVLSPEERAELEKEDEFGPPILSHVTVRGTRLRTYSRLEMPLLERVVPTEMNYAGRFRYVIGKLLAYKQPVIKPIRTDKQGNTITERTHAIHEELERTLHEFDGYNLDDSVEFNSLTWVNNRARGHYELALVPDPTEPAVGLWMRQADVCFNALRSISKKAAYPDHPVMPYVSFARVPHDTGVEQQIELARRIQQTALPVVLNFGQVKLGSNDRTELGS